MSQQELSREAQEIWALFRETRGQMSETDKKIDRLSEEIGRVNKAVGDLTGKWGKSVEGLVAPGAVRIFRERGIEVHQTHTRIEAHKNDDTMEIDVLVVDDEYAVAISVKSTLKVEDVDSHLETLAKFHKFFPYLADKKILGAVAGVVIDEGAGKYAYRKGLFVITQAGENIKILNDEKFKPKEW